MRRLVLDQPFSALDESGERVIFSRPEVWANPPSEDGSTEIVWDGRFHYRVRTQTLNRCTHPYS
jgi:hypothetical protein